VTTGSKVNKNRFGQKGESGKVTWEPLREEGRKPLKLHNLLMVVLGTIAGIEALKYADVARIKIEAEEGLAVVELPVKILREAGVEPAQGMQVELRVDATPSDLESWDIVLGAEVYSRQESQNALLASAGGLQVVFPESIAKDTAGVGSKVYIKLRFPKG